MATYLARQRRKRKLLEEIWRYRWQYVAISPFYILFAVLGVYPLMYSLVLSFHEWLGAGPWELVGFRNYIELLGDGAFRAALWNSIYYFGIAVPVLVLGSLVLAAVFNSRTLRFRSVYRTVLFLPYVTSEVIVAIVFFSLLDKQFGMLNSFLKILHLPAVPWLVSAGWSKVSVLLLFVWGHLGYYLIIMVAGMQGIPLELYEAAAIDGANSVQAFRYITVPMMRPIILFVVIITTIAVLNMFGAPFVLTGGGPKNSSVSLTLLLYLMAFRFSNFGSASALAFIITAITVGIALVQMKLLRPNE